MLSTAARNALIGPHPPPQVIAKRVLIASFHVVGTCLLLLELLGCQHELDMAKTYDDRSAETTIRYIGVRDGTRQYADYSSIRASILTDAAKTGRSP